MPCVPTLITYTSHSFSSGCRMSARKGALSRLFTAGLTPRASAWKSTWPRAPSLCSVWPSMASPRASLVKLRHAWGQEVLRADLKEGDTAASGGLGARDRCDSGRSCTGSCVVGVRRGAKGGRRVARTCFLGPRLFLVHRGRAADLKNRSALHLLKKNYPRPKIRPQTITSAPRAYSFNPARCG